MLISTSFFCSPTELAPYPPAKLCRKAGQHEPAQSYNALVSSFELVHPIHQAGLTVQPAHQGGPLMDSRGNVIGIVASKLSDITTLALTGQLPENIGYAVRSSYVLGLLETLPEVSKNLKPPNAKNLPLTDLIEQAKKSAVLVLSY